MQHFTKVGEMENVGDYFHFKGINARMSGS